VSVGLLALSKVVNVWLCRRLLPRSSNSIPLVEKSVFIVSEGSWNGRGVEISVECDARQQVAAVAEPLSAVAAGNLFGPEGRDGAGARFLESLLEGEEAVLAVSAMDA
jgi:hypothetical protein